MSRGLQVRQGQWDPSVRSGETTHGEIRWGEWTHVESPSWLIGFVLPNSGLVYEFRDAPKLGDRRVMLPL